MTSLLVVVRGTSPAGGFSFSSGASASPATAPQIGCQGVGGEVDCTVLEMVVHGTDQEVVVVLVHGLMHKVLGQRTRKKLET